MTELDAGTQWWHIPRNWRELDRVGHPFVAEFLNWLYRNDIYPTDVLDDGTFRVARFTPYNPDKYIAYYTTLGKDESGLLGPMQNAVRVTGFPPTYKEDIDK